MEEETQCDWSDQSKLVEALKRGNLSAVTYLAKQLPTRFFGTAKDRIGNSEDAEELLNDAAMRIITKIDTFDSAKTSDFWSWVWKIIKNLCTDWKRRHKNGLEEVGLDDFKNLDEVLYLNAPVLMQTEPRSADDNTESQSIKNPLLYEALATLTERERVILECHILHKISDREVAEKVGTSEANVRKYRSRAVKKMKSYVENFKEHSEPQEHPTERSSDIRISGLL